MRGAQKRGAGPGAAHQRKGCRHRRERKCDLDQPATERGFGKRLPDGSHRGIEPIGEGNSEQDTGEGEPARKGSSAQTHSAEVKYEDQPVHQAGNARSPAAVGRFLCLHIVSDQPKVRGVAP